MTENGKDSQILSFTDKVVKEWSQKTKIFEGHDFAIIKDAYPVNKGHLLIYSKNPERVTLFDLAEEEYIDLFLFIEKARQYLQSKYNPDGYNIGMNCGEYAGQTVMRFHVHIIPRYKGDIDNPRGGIRNFKKALVEYK